MRVYGASATSLAKQNSMNASRPKQIVVYSKQDAATFQCAAPWACVSIATQAGTWPKIDEGRRQALLQLAFADLEIPAPGQSLFCESHAEEILDLVRDVWDHVELIMVHCEAGVSRSPAVAAAIARIHLGKDQAFFQPGVFNPNQLVYQTLLNVARQRGEFAEKRNPRRNRRRRSSP